MHYAATTRGEMERECPAFLEVLRKNVLADLSSEDIAAAIDDPLGPSDTRHSRITVAPKADGHMYCLDRWHGDVGIEYAGVRDDLARALKSPDTQGKYHGEREEFRDSVMDQFTERDYIVGANRLPLPSFTDIGAECADTLVLAQLGLHNPHLTKVPADFAALEPTEQRARAITRGYYADCEYGETPELPNGWDVFSIPVRYLASPQLKWEEVPGKPIDGLGADKGVHTFAHYDSGNQRWNIRECQTGAYVRCEGAATEKEAIVAATKTLARTTKREISQEIQDFLIKDGPSPWYEAHRAELHGITKDAQSSHSR